MQVYIIIHQTAEEAKIDPTLEIVGAYRESKNALECFSFYLDSLEKEWIVDGEAKAFNRFSEQQGNILAYASCDEHSIYVMEEELL